MAPDAKFLRGWKEIAKHLGVSVRTVQRYELEQQLPVYRPQRKKRRMVFAIPEELDAWVVKAALCDVTHDRFAPGVFGNDLKATISELRELNLAVRLLQAQVSQSLAKLNENALSLQKTIGDTRASYSVFSKRIN